MRKDKEKENFKKMVLMIEEYLEKYGLNICVTADMKDLSLNMDGKTKNYLYNESDLKAIDMDRLAREGYKKIIKKEDLNENPISSCDAFLINEENDWFFVEFKDACLKNGDQKKDLVKKAYSNWYMLMDILFESKKEEYGYKDFQYENPCDFARKKIHYLIVASNEKNPKLYLDSKEKRKAGLSYTPDFLKCLQDYLFKDVHICTEEQFRRDFTKKFKY